ncbi:23577_t:CDS:1, partial [Dentiscutata erythropus]
LILDKSQTKKILAKETLTKKISRKRKVSSDSHIVGSKSDSSAIKKNTSSIDRFKEPQCAQTLFNTSRRKADLEKLIKDTERLAPICPSLP